MSINLNFLGIEYKYPTLEKLNHSLFHEEPASASTNNLDNGKTSSILATPLSVAKRTKQVRV